MQNSRSHNFQQQGLPLDPAPVDLPAQPLPKILPMKACRAA
jgi:hypothetical protein